jgi:mRNA interferase RelE/StbE
MYEIYLERSAEKDLRKLRPPFFNTVLAKIKALANNPHPRGSRKIIDSDNFWRIKIGSYRVLYEIIDSKNTIRIYKIRHRKDAYK